MTHYISFLISKLPSRRKSMEEKRLSLSKGGQLAHSLTTERDQNLLQSKEYLVHKRKTRKK